MNSLLQAMVFTLISVCSMSLGCNAYKDGKEIAPGAFYPIEPRFTEHTGCENAVTTKENGLDFEAVYISDHEDGSVTYYRFLPTGKIISRWNQGIPTQEDAGSIENAVIGSYCVKGNVVYVEFFVRHAGIMEWDYMGFYAKIEERGIRMLKTREWRSDGWSNTDIISTDYICEKHQLDGLSPLTLPIH